MSGEPAWTAMHTPLYTPKNSLLDNAITQDGDKLYAISWCCSMWRVPVWDTRMNWHCPTCGKSIEQQPTSSFTSNVWEIKNNHTGSGTDVLSDWEQELLAANWVSVWIGTRHVQVAIDFKD